MILKQANTYSQYQSDSDSFKRNQDSFEEKDLEYKPFRGTEAFHGLNILLFLNEQHIQGCHEIECRQNKNEQ